MPPVNHERLRDRRDELDLSNADIAGSVERAPKYIENILCGSDEPSMRTIHRLSRVLDLPVDEITAGKRTPKGDPSEPPIQPKNEPTHPPKRQEKEQDRKAPPRVTEAVA